MNRINRRLHYNYQKGIIPAFTTKIYLTRDVFFIPDEFRFYVNINGWWCVPFFPRCFVCENGKIYLKILNHSFGLNKDYEYCFIFPNIPFYQYYSEIKDEEITTKSSMNPQINLFQ